MPQNDLLDCLEHIDPSTCSYTEWVEVGMALKHEGYTVTDWDAWSKRDTSRYHAGECEKKWESFSGSGTPVTGGSIVQMAKDNGWKPSYVYEDMDWDSTIGGRDSLVVVDKGWIEGTDIVIPQEWNPVEQMIHYLETLFDSSDVVGYVCETYQKDDGKYLPTQGVYTRTAGELISELHKTGSVSEALGDYNPEAGAWIRFNPLDGKGVRNDNVTEYRYALVESDTADLSHQNTILRQLELPIAALVYSGGKSLHAVVRIDAGSFDEYRKRVDYLYDVCKRNGLEIDRQNRNPSRLSRLPGVERKGEKQYLLDTNIGKPSFTEWRDFIEAVNDDLPDPESMEDVWENLPSLSPALIDGVLRQGHKMLLAGPSKAGKSFALIELCCCIAEGRPWMGFNCTAGRVLYVNLELDRASCLHRFKDVYRALGIPAQNLSNIDIWNLRGKSVPMDKLAPKLIRRAYKKNYIAVIIDPIYKVITGDENSADQMAHFCNQFDRVCTELGCAVIYCHHHSKGAQGGKQAMDRASGSGVFARDPDALLDMIEIQLTDGLLEEQMGKATCAVCADWLGRFAQSHYNDIVSQDDACSPARMKEIARAHLSTKSYSLMMEDVAKACSAVRTKSAWRIEGTLREYPKFPPVNTWFDYPVHRIDDVGVLKDAKCVGEFVPKSETWKQNFKKDQAERKKEQKQTRKDSIMQCFEACNMDGEVTVQDMAEYSGKSERTIRNHLEEHGGFTVINNRVYLNNSNTE